jgi:hypothetical protein
MAKSKKPRPLLFSNALIPSQVFNQAGATVLVGALAIFGIFVLYHSRAVTPGLANTPTVTSVTADSISLSWDPSLGTAGQSAYRVYRDHSLITTTTAYDYTDQGLSPDTYYTYTVQAVDSAGNSSGTPGKVTAETYRLCLIVCLH